MSFDWRTDGPTAASRAFHAWRARQSGERSVQDGFGAGFADGSRWTVVTTGNLAPSIASLIDFVQWLRSETEAEREAAVP